MQENAPNKVAEVLELFKTCNVDAWANSLKEKYLQTALQHLEDIAVVSSRKQALIELAGFLIQRDY